MIRSLFISMVLLTLSTLPAAPHPSGNVDIDVNLNKNISKSSSVSGSRSNSSTSSQSDSNSSINYRSSTVYPAIPQEPDHSNEHGLIPFEWHESQREKTSRYKRESAVLRSERFDIEEQNLHYLDAHREYKNLRIAGLDDKAAKEVLQYRAGITRSRPVIINGRVAGYCINC